MPEMRTTYFAGGEKEMESMARETVPKRGAIQKSDFEKHGYTPK